jgi:hypothetical protein
VRRWEQQLVNTPFERILTECAVEIRLDRASEGEGEGTTEVAITLAQRLRGLGLLGGFMVRSAARKQLDGALDGLEALVRPG